MRWRTRAVLILVATFVITIFPESPRAQEAVALQSPPIPSRKIPPLAKLPKAFQPDIASSDDHNFGRKWNHAYVGDPIDVVSGAYTFSVTDLSVHGRGMNFTFTRTYNSADSWYGSSSFIGAGWVHSYDWELEDGVCASRFKLRRGDGGRGIAPDDLSFSNDGAPYGSRTYTLVTRDHTTYTFGDPLYQYVDPETPIPCPDGTGTSLSE